MTVSIIICSSPMVCATAMLNANSVPENARADLNATAGRLAIFLDHVRAIPSDVERAQLEFCAHLQRNWIDYAAAAKTRPDLQFVAHADGLEYLSRLHATLYEFKALLDLFTRLMCRLVASPSPPHGFNKGKVDGVEVSGGRLICWLQGHAVERLPTRDALVHTLLTATREWITPAVALRDTLGHKRDIPGFQHVRIPVSSILASVKPAHLLLPEMADGRGLQAFVVDLRDRLCHLLSALLPLVPRVNPALNESWEKAKCRLSA